MMIDEWKYHFCEFTLPCVRTCVSVMAPGEGARLARLVMIHNLWIMNVQRYGQYLMIINTEFKKSNIAFDKVASNHNIACPQSDKEWTNRRLNFFHMMFMILRATMSQNQGFQPRKIPWLIIQSSTIVTILIQPNRYLRWESFLKAWLNHDGLIHCYCPNTSVVEILFRTH